MKPAYILDDKCLSIVFLDTGRNYTVFKNTCINWDLTIERLKNEDYENLETLISAKSIIDNVADKLGGAALDHLGVSVDGRYVDNYLTRKIISFANNNKPYKPLLRFLEKLLLNPSKRAVDELYKFLEHGNMPITEDGDFIAYKSVTPEYKDWHTKSVDNSIGAKPPRMPRNEVSDDCDVECGSGYHAGTFSYASTFAWKFHSSAGRVVLVKINPANVVSVPKDHNNRKLRCCEYEVVAEFEKILDNDYTPCYNTWEVDELCDCTLDKNCCSTNPTQLKRDSKGRFCK